MRRIAHAVRGLKCIMGRLSIPYNMSHRSRGAWIEIHFRIIRKSDISRSHRSRGVLIEIGALISAYSLIV